MELSQVIVRPVHRAEEVRFQELMDLYHYLGALPKIGNTIWYVATNNNESRFLILPQHHHLNLESKIVSLVKRRIQQDWEDRFGHPLLLMETFVDPSRFLGNVYHATNWECIGKSKGYQRTREGYSNSPQTQKLVFV